MRRFGRLLLPGMLGFTLLLSVLDFVPTPVFAEPAETAAVSPEEARAQADRDKERVQQRERFQQKQIAVGLFLLVGLILASMIGFAILWGIRTRRIVRQPLPEAPRGDELWYLKKPITPPGESSETPAAAPPNPAPPDAPSKPPSADQS